MNSGIMPYLSRSSGSTSWISSHWLRSTFLFMPAPKPISFWPMRFSMMSSRPVNAPPQMNRMFVVSTWRNSCCGCLRPAFAGHVARDRRVVALAGDLVDLVDVDDAALGALDVVIGVLQQRDDDVLDVLADVAGLGEVGRVGDRERHVEDARQGLGEQGLARAGRPEQQDVRLLELDVLVALAGLLVIDPLVVGVDR